MTTFFQNFGLSEFVFTLLLGEFIIISGNWLYDQIKTQWQKNKYGGWKVTVKHPTKPTITRNLSARKIREIKEDEADLSVLLKGVASGFDWINTDLITKGREIGMLTEDPIEKVYIIDFKKNPQSKE